MPKSNLNFGGNATGDLDDDLLSDPIDIEAQTPVSLGIQLEWTADAVGPITVEVQLDGQHWEPLDDLVVQVDGANGSDFIDIDRVKAEKLRLNFTHVSGTTGVLSGVYTIRNG